MGNGGFSHLQSNSVQLPHVCFGGSDWTRRGSGAIPSPFLFSSFNAPCGLYALFAEHFAPRQKSADRRGRKAKQASFGALNRRNFDSISSEVKKVQNKRLRSECRWGEMHVNAKEIGLNNVFFGLSFHASKYGYFSTRPRTLKKNPVEMRQLPGASLLLSFSSRHLGAQKREVKVREWREIFFSSLQCPQAKTEKTTTAQELPFFSSSYSKDGGWEGHNMSKAN